MLTLSNILQDMKVMLQQLTEILSHENQLLIENSPVQQLSEIIDKKSKLLLSLKLLDDERIRVGKQASLESPYTGDELIETEWNHVTKTTAELAEMNRENGLIMQARMDQTMKSIDFLNNMNSTPVYTHGGHMKDEPISKKRAEA